MQAAMPAAGSTIRQLAQLARSRGPGFTRCRLCGQHGDDSSEPLLDETDPALEVQSDEFDLDKFLRASVTFSAGTLRRIRRTLSVAGKPSLASTSRWL